MKIKLFTAIATCLLISACTKEKITEEPNSRYAYYADSSNIFAVNISKDSQKTIPIAKLITNDTLSIGQSVWVIAHPKTINSEQKTALIYLDDGHFYAIDREAQKPEPPRQISSESITTICNAVVIFDNLFFEKIYEDGKCHEHEINWTRKWKKIDLTLSAKDSAIDAPDPLSTNLNWPNFFINPITGNKKFITYTNIGINILDENFNSVASITGTGGMIESVSNNNGKYLIKFNDTTGTSSEIYLFDVDTAELKHLIGINDIPSEPSYQPLSLWSTEIDSFITLVSFDSYNSVLKISISGNTEEIFNTPKNVQITELASSKKGLLIGASNTNSSNIYYLDYRTNPLLPIHISNEKNHIGWELSDNGLALFSCPSCLSQTYGSIFNAGAIKIIDGSTTIFANASWIKNAANSQNKHQYPEKNYIKYWPSQQNNSQSLARINPLNLERTYITGLPESIRIMDFKIYSMEQAFDLLEIQTPDGQMLGLIDPKTNAIRMLTTTPSHYVNWIREDGAYSPY